MEGTGWFYVRDGKRQGPVPLQQVVDLIIAGVIPRQGLVWREGLAEWCAADSVPEISSQLPPPLPNPPAPIGAPMPSGPTTSPPAKEPAWYKATWETPNRLATVGVWMAFVSIFCYTIGLIPVLSVVFSTIGFFKAPQYGGWGKTRAKIGLVVGILYTWMYLRHYKHLP